MSRILVTGGTGFIGSFLVEHLSKGGDEIVVFDNNFRGKASNIANLKSVKLIEGDVRKREDVDKVMGGVDVVYHLAAINGTKYFYEMPEKVLEVNVKGLINVLESAIEHGVEKFIFTSSSEVYNQPEHVPTTEKERIMIPDITNPRFSYAGSKIIGELFCINYGRKNKIKPIIVRYHNIYGPKMGHEHVIPEFIARMRKLSEKSKKIKFPIEGTGEETRAFCFVTDAVEATIIAAENGEKNEIYNIGNNTTQTKIRDLAFMIAEILGIEITIETGKAKAGGTAARCPDIEKIKKLGYMPKVGLKEGLKKTIEWYK